MIRVAHIAPYPHPLVLSYSKFRNPTKFECVVATPQVAPDGAMSNDLRLTDAPVYTGWAACWAAVCWADIVNLHTSGDNYDLYVLAQSCGKPYVLTLHWNRVMPVLPAITICTSSRSYEMQPDKHRCVLIPNGIDLSRFRPKPKPPRQEVVITRICRPDRCALYFWPAMESLLRKYPQVRLWVVGGRENAGRSREQVSFVAHGRDIPEILSQTDIFAYTPYPDEGAKDLVVMEASAMGVPCVVTDAPAVRESIFEGENGFVTPYADVEAFAAKVETLIQDVALRERMGQRAMQIAREQFDMAIGVRSYEALYEGMLDAYGDSQPQTADHEPALVAFKAKAHQVRQEILAAQRALDQEAAALYSHLRHASQVGAEGSASSISASQSVDGPGLMPRQVFLKPRSPYNSTTSPSQPDIPTDCQDLVSAIQEQTGEEPASLVRKLYKEGAYRGQHHSGWSIEDALREYAEALANSPRSLP